MADARGIRAGAAYVELFVNDNKLVRGLRQASARLKAFGTAIGDMGSRMARFGAMALAPLAASAKVFADMGGGLLDMSQRTGVSVEALSELGFAAGQSGADLATLESGLRKMQKAIVNAAKGSDSAQEALKLLNLTVAELDGLSPDQQFKLIADRLAGIQDPTIKAALAMELFGRSGTALLPLMSGGAKGIEQLQQSARDLGLTMSTEDAQAAEAFGDRLDVLWKVLKRGVSIVGSALEPAFSTVAESLTKILVKAGEWIGQNRQVVVTVLKVTAAVLAGGAAMLGLGYAISAAGSIMGAAATAITAVGSAIGILGAVLAAILSPIGLTITAVAALATYILYATGAGAHALSWLADRLNSLKDTALAAFGGISDALAAGDIGLAARILWLTLKLAWDNGVAMLQQVWTSFTGWFVKLAAGAFYGALAAAEIAWHAMKVVWIEGVAFLRKLWTEFTTWHARAVESTADVMVRSWIWVREQTGAITSDQAAFERDYARKQHDQQARQIESDRQSSLDQAARQRDAGLAGESQRYEGRLADIGQGYQGIADSLEAERAEKARKTEEALAAARKEWQEAIAEAQRKRQAREGEDSGMPSLGSAPSIDDLAEQLAGLGDLLNQKARQTIGVSGTFNAAEARGLAGGGVADRIASATEQTARNTKRLLDRADQGGLAFE
jgi:hypothetical protein